MNNLPPRLEKYDREGWYRYLHRAINLKNAPNDELDMNVYSRCIVGRCRGGAIYFSEKKASETYCKACNIYSRILFKQYNILMDGGNDSFRYDLNDFLTHMEQSH